MRKFTPVIASNWDGYGIYENSRYATMQESKNGEWVKLSTFNDTVAMLNAQIERLKKLLNEKYDETNIKIGDKLRIVSTKGNWEHCFAVGDIVVVESIEANKNDHWPQYKLDYNVVREKGSRNLHQVINIDDFVKV